MFLPRSAKGEKRYCADLCALYRPRTVYNNCETEIGTACRKAPVILPGVPFEDSEPAKEDAESRRYRWAITQLYFAVGCEVFAAGLVMLLAFGEEPPRVHQQDLGEQVCQRRLQQE